MAVSIYKQEVVSTGISVWYAGTMGLFRWISVAATFSCLGSSVACWLPIALAASPAAGSQSAPGNRAPEAPAKVRRYAERLLQRYDRNGDGVLEQSEWSAMHGQPEAADADRNGKITLEEWTNHIASFGRGHRMSLSSPDAGAESASRAASSAREGETSVDKALLQPPTRLPPNTTFHVSKSRLPAGLPDWFRSRDRNGDGQVSLSEYAPNAAPADVEQFARYDRNGDGLITVEECLGGRAATGRKKGGSGDKGEKKSDAK